MEIRIKMNEEQMKKLKEFGLGGIFDDALKNLSSFGMGEVSKDINFFKPLRIKHSEVVRKPLSNEELKSIEKFALHQLHLDVRDFVLENNKREILRCMLTRLSPHSLASLVQSK